MIFTQYYLDCLSQASYLIGDETTGKAVVVDPRRDTAGYLGDLDRLGLALVGVIDTHFHADFVAGHLELAAETGAWIGFGAAGRTEFASRALHDRERIVLGDVVLEILATPGHTPESITVLVYEHRTDDVPYAALIGDTLFIGDVGRPDLLASVGKTPEELGRRLYHSVQHTLMALPDQVRVFPAHGAGSSCGKNLSAERQSTIGRQRATNHACQCQPMSKAQFVALVSADQPAAPGYFLYNAMLNRHYHDRRADSDAVPALNGADVDRALAGGAILVDTRDVEEFAAGHLPGSITVAHDGRLAETAGTVLLPSDRIVLLSAAGRETDDATRLSRIGYDAVLGHVADPQAYLRGHAADLRPASRLTAVQLDTVRDTTALQLVDLRNPAERAAGMIPHALAIPFPQLERRIDELDLDAPIVLYCAAGWRSSVAASVLRRYGGSDVSDLIGGYDAWALHRVVAAS
jgi:hydroxyacylglutathione hydrolase